MTGYLESKSGDTGSDDGAHGSSVVAGSACGHNNRSSLRGDNDGGRLDRGRLDGGRLRRRNHGGRLRRNHGGRLRRNHGRRLRRNHSGRLRGRSLGSGHDNRGGLGRWDNLGRGSRGRSGLGGQGDGDWAAWHARLVIPYLERKGGRGLLVMVRVVGLVTVIVWPPLVMVVGVCHFCQQSHPRDH